MPAYPSTLPNPLVSGYGIEPANPIARTDMEWGPARTRRRFTSFPDFPTVRWKLTLEELAVFEAWHRLTILDGESWFDCILENGLELNTVQSKFVGVPKKTKASKRMFFVDAKLEVRNFPVLTQDYLDVGVAYRPVELTYASPTLHQLMHITRPINYSGYF